MNRKTNLAIIAGILALNLAGCGNTPNKVQTQNIGSARSSLTKPFSDILYGFKKMEKYVARGDFASATALSHNLYDEFHDTILPPLIKKKGQTYAKNMDEKYDELEAAVTSKNKSKITELIKVNRDNLKTIAPILGVSVISFE